MNWKGKCSLKVYMIVRVLLEIEDAFLYTLPQGWLHTPCLPLDKMLSNSKN